MLHNHAHREVLTALNMVPDHAIKEIGVDPQALRAEINAYFKGFRSADHSGSRRWVDDPRWLGIWPEGKETVSDSPSGPTLEDVIATYCDAWSQPDPSRREQMLKDVWTEQGIYTDPTVQISGVKALVNHIGTVLARHPGSRVVMTSLLDAHHGMVRFEWRRILADGRALPVGVDFGELASNGKLRRIVGFFGPLAPG